MLRFHDAEDVHRVPACVEGVLCIRCVVQQRPVSRVTVPHHQRERTVLRNDSSPPSPPSPRLPNSPPTTLRIQRRLRACVSAGHSCRKETPHGLTGSTYLARSPAFLARYEGSAPDTPPRRTQQDKRWRRIRCLSRPCRRPSRPGCDEVNKHKRFVSNTEHY